MPISKNSQNKKLIIGFIYKDERTLKNIEAILIRKFGDIDKESQQFDFVHTKYYEKEMSGDLKRKFISFKRLINLEGIWWIKLFTNKLEAKFSINNRRKVNVDPGYMSLSKLILLTTKDYTHRLYLGCGIFGEVTLFFKNDSFQPWTHTYPDYKTPEYIEFFNSVRRLYKRQLS